MSGCVTFHVNQLQTILRELDEERAERRRQASMIEMLMDDLRLRSGEELSLAPASQASQSEDAAALHQI